MEREWNCRYHDVSKVGSIPCGIQQSSPLPILTLVAQHDILRAGQRDTVSAAILMPSYILLAHAGMIFCPPVRQGS